MCKTFRPKIRQLNLETNSFVLGSGKAKAMTKKIYLSDGAYAAIDARGLVLTAENGIEATDTVVLDDEGWARLVAFMRSILEGESPEVGPGSGQPNGTKASKTLAILRCSSLHTRRVAGSTPAAPTTSLLRILESFAGFFGHT